MNGAERRRYSRHLLIPEVGLRGQERLAAGKVLVVGAGGLGSPALQYLAAAGIGRIGVVDDDAVDETNLQRQTIFNTADVGANKAIVAAARLHALNHYVAVDAFPIRFDEENARQLVRGYDVVLDCTDRFPTRYLINDACYLEKKIDVYASIFRFDGQLSVLCAPGGPCYRCLYPQAPPEELTPTCADGGVLGALAGLVGAWQAERGAQGRSWYRRAARRAAAPRRSLAARVRDVRFDREPQCALCGDAPTITGIEKRAYESAAVQSAVAEIEADRLDEALREATLLDVREPHEAVLGSVPGAVQIPASQLYERMPELDSAVRYIVACRVGIKSLWAVAVYGKPDSSACCICAEACSRTPRAKKTSSSSRVQCR